MYLKALEIQGFKSFPDKTRLSFDGDITAIVGPNGSGKSNISDAIRWVMGEMSTKALRGAKMEDVIFGGTLKRGQLGFAEVSLILDNADRAFNIDAPEIMVTRRFFRSGDSEYYINRQSARLKDINELFMDTGLGREGYSNIGQGRIDEILSVKSQDRREIFEEAAGISKFRHRKEETERKLKSTDENLVRIGDKIAELELQVEPLRVQAEKAKKYLLYRDELRGLEVSVWLDTLEKLAVTAKKTEEDFNSASFILAQEHDNLEALYQQIERAAQSLRERDSAQESLRDEIGALENESQRIAGEIAVHQTQIDSNNANIDRIRQELTEQEDRSGSLIEQIARHEARAQEIGAELEQIHADLQTALEEARRVTDSSDGLSQKILALRSEQADALAQIADHRAKLGSVSASLQALHEREESLKHTVDEAQEKRASARAQLDSCRKTLNAAREEAQGAQNMIDGYRLRMASRASKRDELQKKVTDLGIEADTVASRIRMFREMEREYEGYSKSVRVIMQEAERGSLRGVHGPVSRLMQTDDRYAIAIETALGNAMQNIVVSSEADGKAGINLLKRRDAGRATFVPISTTRSRLLDEKGLGDKTGFVGIASDLVRFDGQYRNIFENLLGRIVVADDLDCAVAIAKQYAYRFRIVTLDGQVVNPGGSMTGGSTQRSSGILSRANELRRLDERAKELQTLSNAAAQELQEAKRQAAQVEFEITEAEGRKRIAEDEVLRLEGQEGQCALLLDAAISAIDAGEEELESLQLRAEAMGKEYASTEQAVAQLQQRADLLEQQAEELSAGQAEFMQRNEKITESINQIHMQTAALEAERQTARESVQQLRALEQAMSGDLVQKQELIAQFDQENAGLAAQIADCTEAVLELDRQIAAHRQSFQDAAQARNEEEARKTALEKQTQDKNKDILLMERETARLEQKKNATAMEQQQIIDKLWDSYELTRTTAQTARQPIESTAEANRRITELKRKITGLGTPNLGAIEEYDRVNERYTYLTSQRDDVQSAKRDLESIIGDIVAEMTEIFRVEFGRINEAFGGTFVELFGGGRATLELEDENDILNCGIEIKAQPPGKQLKSITLLSGGEKALVAIALYFAILKVRPTPFCMLDEIDAALDDRNVAMYAAYLRNLSDKTQFIVITHRRGTMEEADVLYGVTMQEQGVSKILTIDLNQMAQQLGITD